MQTTFLRLLTSTVLVLALNAAAQAGLMSTPNLASIKFWEATGPVTPYTFAFNSSQMTTQLVTLNSSTADFSGLSDENYDVFYSDVAGNFVLNGDWITVQANFPRDFAGGGLNLGAVDLVFSNSSILRADTLGSFVGLGTNYIPGSELNAVDVDSATPVTFTTMGNNNGIPQRLSVTVGFSSVPEPSSLALLGLGALGMLGIALRRRA